LLLTLLCNHTTAAAAAAAAGHDNERDDPPMAPRPLRHRRVAYADVACTAERAKNKMNYLDLDHFEVQGSQRCLQAFVLQHVSVLLSAQLP